MIHVPLRTDGGHRASILSAVRVSSAPLDDDQLAAKTGITPRQTVNIICRQLRDEGVIDRVTGPDGKIVNVLRRAAATEHEQPAADESVSGTRDATTAATEPAGHAREQRLAEVHLLDALAKELGKALAPTTIRLPSGVRVEVDGADVDQGVLVECWAHIGKVKGAQRLKVLTDAFKLTWIANNIPGRPRLILCMGDREAAAPFLNKRAWFGQALADQGVEVIVVPLPDEVRQAVIQAQQRQFR